MLQTIKTILSASVVSFALLAPAAASENMLRVSYQEDPKTADVQKTTDAYTLPLRLRTH